MQAATPPVLAALRGEGAELLFRRVGDRRGGGGAQRRGDAAPVRLRGEIGFADPGADRARDPRGIASSASRIVQIKRPSNNPEIGPWERLRSSITATIRPPCGAIGAVVMRLCPLAARASAVEETTRTPAPVLLLTSRHPFQFCRRSEAKPGTRTIVSAAVSAILIGDAERRPLGRGDFRHGANLRKGGADLSMMARPAPKVLSMSLEKLKKDFCSAFRRHAPRNVWR